MTQKEKKEMRKFLKRVLNKIKKKDISGAEGAIQGKLWLLREKDE